MDSASVIIRSFNRAHTIQRTFDGLVRQTVRPEIVVVDSGSTDGTLDIARRYADRLIEIAPEDFSYGRALNIGAAAASGDVHFALSSHCFPSHDEWIAQALGHHGRPDVAGTNGAASTPDYSRPLEGVVFYGEAEHRVNPYWGFSNHGSSWRADVWRSHPFDEALVACEDKEWAHRVMRAGYLIAYDPMLLVGNAHRLAEGVRAVWRRTQRETRALRQFTDVDPRPVSDLVKAWWGEPEPVPLKYRVRHRLDPRRSAEILGHWYAERA